MISDRAQIIRLARASDLDEIAGLQTRAIMASGKGTYSHAVCKAWARMGRQIRHTLLDTGTFFVAERQGDLIGVAGWAKDSREPDSAWPRYLFIDPAHARLGIGRKLMITIERSVHAAGRTRLMLWASLNAVGFYQALGYHVVKPARWPIGGGIEMEHLLMEKVLTSSGGR